MSKTVEKTSSLSYEDAKYLADRGRLTAEEQEKYGITSNPLGGSPADAGANTGDVGGSSEAEVAPGSGAPSPDEVAKAAAEASAQEPEKAPAKKTAKRSAAAKKRG